MRKNSTPAKDILLSGGILCLCFILCLILQWFLLENALISAIFVLGVFLISVLTSGYVYGIASALLSVLAVNFAFTFPYFSFNFTVPENIVSAGILLAVTLVTCGLTAKVRHQEAVKAESERERMRANLLRAISHDLRTPLTTMYSSSAALLEHYDEFTDAQFKKMLHGISGDAQWLSRMVENLLSITRLDGGNVHLFKTETVLDELIDSVLVKFAKRYPHQAVIVDIPDAFITIPMDALLIEQVLINILENAVQHATGMTTLTLSVSATAGQAVFSVTDDGCGMPKDKCEIVFSGAFSSASSLSDSNKNNAGIGLSVCASIIKAHGGSIVAENRPEGGCIFSFTLHMEAENA